MKKRLLASMVLGLSFVLCAGAQQDTTFIESSKPKLINDYSLIGANYGVSFSNMYFNPQKHNRAFVFAPNYVSVTYTKFSKMFGNLPYFALVVGAAMGNEGYAFNADKETGTSADVDGATWCSMRVFEIPVMTQIHADFDPGKIMANVGVYGGWRESITRRGPSLDPAWTGSFREYEHRLDYGLQGGVGFALMFDPIEIHFNCLIRWSWSNLYEPDYASQYYYRYAYPLDVIATVGIHFQLTKRHGKTRKELKRQAYDIVYGQTADNSGTDR